MMHPVASALGRILRRENRRLALLFALFVAAAVSAACEDKGLGRTCDIPLPPSSTQGVYVAGAPDCPSRLCVKPAVQIGVSKDLDTGPYCTTLCDSDKDCNGQTRDSNNPNDKRCKKGYTCAITFGSGEVVQPDSGAPQSLCCVKICLCKDFFSQAYGPAVPDECKPGADASCP